MYLNTLFLVIPLLRIPYILDLIIYELDVADFANIANIIMNIYNNINYMMPVKNL